jgi:hypothetical protein
MAEGRYGPKGATLEDLQQQIADLRSEIDRLNPEATDKKRSKLLAAAINEETRPSVGDLRPFPGHGFASAQTRLITVAAGGMLAMRWAVFGWRLPIWRPSSH